MECRKIISIRHIRMLTLVVSLHNYFNLNYGLHAFPTTPYGRRRDTPEEVRETEEKGLGFQCSCVCCIAVDSVLILPFILGPL